MAALKAVRMVDLKAVSWVGLTAWNLVAQLVAEMADYSAVH